MTSYVAKVTYGMANVMRRVGAVLDNVGKKMEVTQYTENLVPSTMFVAVNGVEPKVSSMSFIAPSASIIGDVTIGKESSVWYSAVVRGDVNKITIGSKTSIGDRAVVHVAKIQGDFSTHIGNNVTVGAGAVIHAATVHDSVVVGEMAQVLDGSIINSNSVIAPASIVNPGTLIPSGELWAGSPAKKSRELTPVEIANISALATDTMKLALQHAIENAKSHDQVQEEQELADIEMYMDPDEKQYPEDFDDTHILGQGEPGRIFRSKLSHPEEAFEEEMKKQQKAQQK